MSHWNYNDGGRSAAGYKGETSDCVTRAIAIACELPYQTVYDALHIAVKEDRVHMAKLELRYGANAKRHVSPRAGVFRKTYQPFLEAIGWEWVSTMRVGSGCRVHLREDELPSGRLICKVSKHLVAVIDGVICDTHDCSRGGERCVYGIFHNPKEPGKILGEINELRWRIQGS
jgi:hypothetical protein